MLRMRRICFRPIMSPSFSNVYPGVIPRRWHRQHFEYSFSTRIMIGLSVSGILKRGEYTWTISFVMQSRVICCLLWKTDRTCRPLLIQTGLMTMSHTNSYTVISPHLQRRDVVVRHDIRQIVELSVRPFHQMED